MSIKSILSVATKNPESLAEALNNPEKLKLLLKDVLLKYRFELDLKLIGLPRSDEQPNHDYALLFSDDGLDSQKLAIIINNMMESSNLPVTIRSAKVKRQGNKSSNYKSEIFHCLFLDIKPKIIGEK